MMILRPWIELFAKNKHRSRHRQTSSTHPSVRHVMQADPPHKELFLFFHFIHSFYSFILFIHSFIHSVSHSVIQSIVMSWHWSSAISSPPGCVIVGKLFSQWLDHFDELLRYPSKGNAVKLSWALWGDLVLEWVGEAKDTSLRPY